MKTLLEKAQAEVSRLWVLMCDEEGVAHDAKFVVFNSTNKYAVQYNAAAKTYLKLRKRKHQQKAARQSRREVLDSLGMKEVRGALGGRYIE